MLEIYVYLRKLQAYRNCVHLIWGTRNDLRNEIFILNIVKRFQQKSTKTDVGNPFISQILNNLKTYGNCVYFSMEYKEWSMKWAIHFELKWRDSNNNQLKQMLEICLYLNNLKTYGNCVDLSMECKEWPAKVRLNVNEDIPMKMVSRQTIS